MKSAILPIILVCGVLLVGSCDKLEQPYATEKDIKVDSTKRKILLEDYTGLKCVNCPKATALAMSLQELYKGQVIVMTVHAGYYAEPDAVPPYNTDYRVAEGTSWFTDFNLLVNPMGMVNRVDRNSSKAIKSDDWANVIKDVAKEATVAKINIQTVYTEKSRHHITTTVNTKFLASLEGTYNLSVCILEDSITGWQKNNDTTVGPVPNIENYVFNDMLRAVLNGTYGESITSAVDTSETYSKTITYTLTPGWIPEHLSVLAFVFHQDTKEIIQVEKKHIID